jgi:hypothetical protein
MARNKYRLLPMNKNYYLKKQAELTTQALYSPYALDRQMALRALKVIDQILETIDGEEAQRTHIARLAAMINRGEMK